MPQRTASVRIAFTLALFGWLAAIPSRAASIQVPSTDLTQYTRRNGGTFPAALVYRIIEGGDVPSHGNREMPVWGSVFKLGSSAAEVTARIEAIVRYLAGIQERGA